MNNNSRRYDLYFVLVTLGVERKVDRVNFPLWKLVPIYRACWCDELRSNCTSPTKTQCGGVKTCSNCTRIVCRNCAVKPCGRWRSSGSANRQRKVMAPTTGKGHAHSGACHAAAMTLGPGNNRRHFSLENGRLDSVSNSGICLLGRRDPVRSAWCGVVAGVEGGTHRRTRVRYSNRLRIGTTSIRVARRPWGSATDASAIIPGTPASVKSTEKLVCGFTRVSKTTAIGSAIVFLAKTPPLSITDACHRHSVMRYAASGTKKAELVFQRFCV